eukprot:m.332000 g.332000  ORF g.332000 m.332000 type:complete len:61 (+) comp27727_c1_seq19:3421-3603(+)
MGSAERLHKKKREQSGHVVASGFWDNHSLWNTWYAASFASSACFGDRNTAYDPSAETDFF